MTTGRELDALVAEKVMGWKRLTWEEANPTNHNFKGRTDLSIYWYHSNLAEMRLAEDDDDYYNSSPAWSPSIDISAAWEVIEKLKGQSIVLNYGEDTTEDIVTKKSMSRIMLWLRPGSFQVSLGGDRHTGLS